MGKWRIERCKECAPFYVTWNLSGPDGYDHGCFETWAGALATIPSLVDAMVRPVGAGV
jgi:hypothetical protein